MRPLGDRPILFASGLIAGDALMGIGIAGAHRERPRRARSRSARPGRRGDGDRGAAHDRCRSSLLMGVLAWNARRAPADDGRRRSRPRTTPLARVPGRGQAPLPLERRRPSAVRAPRHDRLAADHGADVRTGLPLPTRRLEPRGRRAALRRRPRSLRLAARRRVARRAPTAREAHRDPDRHRHAACRCSAWRSPRSSCPLAFNLAVFAIFYCAFNVLNGLQGVVFGLLMAKVIPLGRRGRFIGARDFAGGATAALVAWIAASWLERRRVPGEPRAHVSAGVRLHLARARSASRRSASRARPSSPEQRSLGATLASVRGLLATDPSFAGTARRAASAASASWRRPS